MAGWAASIAYSAARVSGSERVSEAHEPAQAAVSGSGRYIVALDGGGNVVVTPNPL